MKRIVMKHIVMSLIGFLARGAHVWASRGVVALRCFWLGLRRRGFLERQRLPGRLGFRWRGFLERYWLPWWHRFRRRGLLEWHRLPRRHRLRRRGLLECTGRLWHDSVSLICL